MKYLNENQISELNQAKWAVCYTTIDNNYKEVFNKIQIPVFGCSSFQGVFTPKGFLKGTHFLASYEDDNIESYAVIKKTNSNSAKEIAQEAIQEIIQNIGEPTVLLLHATPGYEERIIEGIDSVVKSKIPIYGGSAADNDITGKWFIFKNDEIVTEGFLLVGFKAQQIYGAFLGGYLPTDKKGIVTKASGRVIYEIDHKPAAEVYNKWTNGAIQEYLDNGGVILAPTTMHPIGRLIDEILGVKMYLLSHPHMVIKENKALSMFTEFKEGDEIILMTGHKNALIYRAKQVIDRALGIKKNEAIKGAINIYCGGCVGAIIKDIDQVIKQYNYSLRDAPYIGAATFGEQGCFIGKTKQNRHGNLMADSIIFC
ncbi:MAG: histidine kinase [Leptospiraceae bacterium]|nr:MAG: histidine kinase [Leptospiraceae bacterium]